MAAQVLTELVSPMLILYVIRNKNTHLNQVILLQAIVEIEQKIWSKSQIQSMDLLGLQDRVKRCNKSTCSTDAERNWKKPYKHLTVQVWNWS